MAPFSQFLLNVVSKVLQFQDLAGIKIRGLGLLIQFLVVVTIVNMLFIKIFALHVLFKGQLEFSWPTENISDDEVEMQVERVSL